MGGKFNIIFYMYKISQISHTQTFNKSGHVQILYIQKCMHLYLPSSIHVMPRDQMSAFPSYCPSSMASMTSGAIQ